MKHKSSSNISHIFVSRRCLLASLCALICCMNILCGCVKHQEEKVLTVSIPPQKWLLDSIVGSRYKVVSMLSANSNPEVFEPSMHQLLDLQSSDAYFTVGNLAFELSALPKIKENFPDLPVYDSSAGINLLSGTHAEDATHDHSFDPHVWTSLNNARVMAKNMYDKVLTLDPDGKEYYTKRYKNLDAGLEALNDSVARILNPLKGSSFVVWHPSLSYFAYDYGIRQLGLETTGKEVSVSQYKNRIDHAESTRPLVFFIQQEFDSRSAKAIARELGIPTVDISLMQPDIPKQIRTITHALTSADK